jgi:hypothetical protein
MTPVIPTESTSSSLTPTAEQWDQMISILKSIEQHLNPPLWKKILGFIFTHAITILSLLTLAYVTWQIWGIVTGMQQQVSNIVGSVGKMKLW